MYEQNEHKFKSAFLIVKGRLSRREGTHNVVVTSVKPFNALEKVPASKDWRWVIKNWNSPSNPWKAEPKGVGNGCRMHCPTYTMRIVYPKELMYQYTWREKCRPYWHHFLGNVKKLCWHISSICVVRIRVGRLIRDLYYFNAGCKVGPSFSLGYFLLFRILATTPVLGDPNSN